MSLMAQLYVVDILFYMYVSEHFTESYDKLEKTRDAIKLLEKKWQDWNLLMMSWFLQFFSQCDKIDLVKDGLKSKI